MPKHFLAYLLFALSFSIPAVAANETKPEIIYYGFDSDIVTNYISTNRRSVGFIRVVVELMLDNKSYLPLAEHHEPLILDTIIDTFSQQPETTIKSLLGREEIRKEVLYKIQKRMQDETGKDVVRDVLFTKYLYQ
ncbi:flagellar basal body-associated FliL family protein [Rheinheimera sp. MMS21-TC3]|uniref:flagellar basal body-associated FliL family protein n=1 Tax=Rheinheimera sp. MMS21-TC3 TaxID=3072790 RepID=UPI0028C3C523|nr:flagellar basal body-associated FliL family protein [Rheinheimera sp. MMS21-TC3]WNO60370.1 flagellar basal body-associated FliL family protein [Rheinheimera sp. MMS21-TC3]